MSESEKKSHIVRIRDRMSASAFPYVLHHGGAELAAGGLTKREYFAACALQGLCAHDLFARDCSESNKTEDDGRLALAVAAVKYAEALVNALDGPTTKEVRNR